MSIVEGFDYDALGDFYHEWYRTDLQIIAIIGDVNMNDIEKRIKDMFSEIPAVETTRTRTVVGIPDNKDILYGLGMDTEVSTASISFGILTKNLWNQGR